MPYHILANTMFDQKNIKQSLTEKFNLQLSTLSFCLGQNDDIAALSFEPSLDYLNRIAKLKLPCQNFCLPSYEEEAIFDSWQIIKNAPFKQKYPYHTLIEELSCKAFAAKLCPPLFDHKIIHDLLNLEDFIKYKSDRYVLKLSKSQSGLGHFFIEGKSCKTLNTLASFDLRNSRVEKWVERVFDFSSQWLLGEEVELLGVCELINNHLGSYKGSIFPISNTNFSSFIEEHLNFVKPYLQQFHKEGLRGHLGIDAFIYFDQGQLALCPLIEINPRKTMGLVALKLSKHFDQRVHITIGEYNPDQSLLPRSIHYKSKTIFFQKNLNLMLP